VSSVDDVVRALRAVLPDVLVAVDFDGTLAPLVADPQDSRPTDGAIEALRTLTARGASVAVVTGRDAGTVVRLGGLDQIPGVRVAGLYGLETWHDGNLDTPDEPATIETVRARLPQTLAEHDADPAVWVEDKRLSLVVHGRRAADPQAALAPLESPLRQLADDLGLEVHPGRDVLELRLPGYDKAGAVRRLAGDHRGVLYLGDDLGDLPAFAEIRRLRARGVPAYSLGVRSSQVAELDGVADAYVADPPAVVEVFRALAGDQPSASS
jgi:trehalose 6-phosphate phosphatase